MNKKSIIIGMVLMTCFIVYAGVVGSDYYQSEGNLSEWKMYGRYMNRIVWDGVDFTIIEGLQKASFSMNGTNTNAVSATVANGYVYTGDSLGIVYQLNASNISQLVFSYDIGSAIISSPSVVNEYVYIGSVDNSFYQLNASNVSQFIASFATGGNGRSTPVVYDDKVYVHGGTDETVYALNASNISQQLDNYTVGSSGGIYASLALAHNCLYFLYQGDYRLYKMNASNLSDIKTTYIGFDYGLSSYLINNDSLYIVTYWDGVYHVNATNISQTFESYYDSDIANPGYSFSQATLLGDSIYTTSHNGYLYQLNASNISQLIDKVYMGGNARFVSATSDYVYAQTTTGFFQFEEGNISHEISSYDHGSGKSQPVLAKDYVYVTSVTGIVFQVNASNLYWGHDWIDNGEINQNLYGCGVITTDNSIITVNETFSTTLGTCIKIEANNVTINGEGNIITGLNAIDTYADNITIKDCTLIGTGGNGIGAYVGTDGTLTLDNINITATSNNVHLQSGNIIITDGIFINNGNNDIIQVGSGATVNITNVNATSATATPIKFINSHGNYVADSIFVQTGTKDAVDFMSSSNNTFTNNYISSAGNDALWLDDVDISANNIFYDCYIVDGGVNFISWSVNLNNTFVNVTYAVGVTESVGVGAELFHAWWFDVTVNKSADGYLEGANITAYDVNGHVEWSVLTENDGQPTSRKYMKEFLANGTSNYFTPHTINISKVGYITNSTTYNISDLTNVVHNVILASDSTPPTFTTIPSNTTINYTQGFGVDFDAEDETEFDSYAINWTTLFTINSTGYLKNSTSNIAVGTYLINVTINDTSNNLNSTIYQVTVNQAIPEGSLTSDLGWTINETQSVTIGLTETNTGDGDLTYIVYRDGVAKATGETWSPALGTYDYILNTTGGANYSTIASIDSQTLTVNDATNPLINYTTGIELNNTYINQDFIFVNVSVTETNEDTIIFNLYNSTHDNLNSSSFTSPIRIINWTNLTDGVYYYNVTVNDTSGNENSTETRIITLDSTFPNISIITPTDGYNIVDYVSGSVPIFTNFSLTETNPDSCWHTIDGGVTNTSVPCLDGYNNFTFSLSSAGTFTLEISANDSAGNENSSSIQIIVSAYTGPQTGGGTTTDPSENEEADFNLYNKTIMCEKVNEFLELRNNYTPDQRESLKNSLSLLFGFGIIDSVLDEYLENFEENCVEIEPDEPGDVVDDEEPEEGIPLYFWILLAIVVAIILVMIISLKRNDVNLVVHQRDG